MSSSKARERAQAPHLPSGDNGVRVLFAERGNDLIQHRKGNIRRRVDGHLVQAWWLPAVINRRTMPPSQT